MSRIYSSEQVSRGHVDKICDQIADAIVTDCLAHDKESRVAVEVLIKNETVIPILPLTSTRLSPRVPYVGTYPRVLPSSIYNRYHTDISNHATE